MPSYWSITILGLMCQVASFQIGNRQLIRNAIVFEATSNRPNIPSHPNVQALPKLVKRCNRFSFGFNAFSSDPDKVEKSFDISTSNLESAFVLFGKTLTIVIFSLPASVAAAFFIFSAHEVLVLVNHIAAHGLYATRIH